MNHHLEQAERYCATEFDGRIAWPGVVAYVYEAGGFGIHNVPPKLSEPSHIDTRLKPNDRGYRVHPCTVPYRVVVSALRRPLYEALLAAGRLRDPRHTGAAGGIVEDRRTAPGA